MHKFLYPVSSIHEITHVLNLGIFLEPYVSCGLKYQSKETVDSAHNPLLDAWAIYA